MPIVAGATSNSTRDAVEKARTIAAITGVDAILTASAVLQQADPGGPVSALQAIAEAVDKPLMLYNVPGRTGANIEPATLARLAQIANIIAIKEASGNITQMADLLNAVPETFLVFSGDDAVTLPLIALAAWASSPWSRTRSRAKWRDDPRGARQRLDEGAQAASQISCR